MADNNNENQWYSRSVSTERLNESINALHKAKVIEKNKVSNQTHQWVKDPDGKTLRLKPIERICEDDLNRIMSKVLNKKHKANEI